MTATYQSGSYQGIVDAFSAVQAAQGEKRYYEANYRGIIEAVSDLKKWGQADGGTNPPGWEPVYDNDGNVIGGGWNPAPENGTLWFDERQGRMFVWIDDDFYQTNGADGLPHVGENPPGQEIPGSFWFNTNTNVLYIYDGSNWTIVSTAAGVSTASLPLSNPTTEAFTINGSTLPPISVATQENYNQWLFAALTALEAGLEANASAEPLDMGATNPATASDGDFFYNTTSNTLLVYSGGTWYPAAPYPDISGDAAITALEAADTGLSNDIQAVQTNLDNAVATLQSLPHLTYSVSSATTATGVDLVLTDSTTATTSVGFTGLNGLVVLKNGDDINIDAGSLQSAITAIQADYLKASDLNPLTAEDSALAYDIGELQTLTASHTASIANAQAAIAAAPSLSDVQARLSLAGGALTGQLDMAGNALRNLPTPTAGSDPTTKAYVDGVDTDIRANHIKRTDGILESVLVNNSHSDKAALDFSGSSFYAQDAFKFKTNSPGTDNYVSFGTSANPWEYSWTFDSDEAFNWIHDDERVFAIQGKNTYAKDLVLCNLTANAAGPLYTNPISVRTKLADLEAATTALTTQINQLEFDTNTKNIYYSDNAPTANLEDGDIWFDSHNLRLNVRHGGFWVFPDRVEDVALKSALYNAVNSSTDYDSLKAGLIAALS